MNKFKEVSKEEYQQFVKNYPRPLEWNVTTVCEPPLGNHNDFSDGKIWPESMVTKVMLYDGSEYHGFKQPVYFILE